jgi:thymidylate kinase
LGDREWRGARYLENREILADAWVDAGIPVASELHQAFYAWFSSLTQRRLFKLRYAPLIGRAVRNSPAAFQALLERTFGERLGRDLLRLAHEGNLAESESLAGRCRRAVWLRALRRRPMATLVGLVRHYAPEVREYLRPDGLTVAILGPDGAGKSSICAAIADDPRGSLPVKRVEVRHLYKRVLPPLYHLRQGRLRQPAAKAAATSDPHGKTLHPPVISLLRMGYFVLDQWLSQLTSERPKLARNVLVLHDRHLLELAVDPRRFRYGGPVWLARWIGRLTPRPDLVVLLDAPPPALQARKREVPFAETARQREAYRALVAALPQGRRVDAARPPGEVAAAVRAAIVARLAERTARRFDIGPGPCRGRMAR